jgi:hypothetical protein
LKLWVDLEFNQYNTDRQFVGMIHRRYVPVEWYNDYEPPDKVVGSLAIHPEHDFVLKI